MWIPIRIGAASRPARAGPARPPDRAGRGREGDEERVALRVDLTAARVRERRAQEPRCSASSVAYSALPSRASSSVEPSTSVNRNVTVPVGSLQRPPREVERGVVEQDRLLELLQRLARVEAELVDQRRARVLVGGERVGLPARAVQRQDQQLAQALAQRMLAHQRLQLGHDLGVTAERQVGLEPQLERDQPQLLQPRDLVARERLVLEIRQRRPPPERQRLTQRRAASSAAPAASSVRPRSSRLSKRSRSSAPGSTGSR